MARVKKSFDRELMYKKIMPTNLKKNSEQGVENNTNDSNNEELSQNETSISINADKIYIYENPMSANNENLDEEILEKQEEQVITEKEELASENKITSLKDEEKSGIVLCNLMEKLVLEKLDMALKKMNCCKCDRCREDIIALALNSLKPMYIVATKDELDNKAEELDKLGLEVTTAVLKAVLSIRKNPRH